MSKLAVSEFFGIAPKIPARYLRDGFAQTATNCEAIGNSLKPIKGMSASLLALNTSNTTTIYKFGQDVTSETQHWFSSDAEVDFCRSQIAGDANEWTFFTGEGAPKATYAGIALGAGRLPVASRPLGLPAPGAAPTVAAQVYTAPTEPAKLYLSPAVLESFTTAYGLYVSLNNEKSYVHAPLSAITATAVAAALDAVAGVKASVSGGGVEVETNAAGRNVTLHIRYSPDTMTTLEAAGALATKARLHVPKWNYDELINWYNEVYNNNPQEYAVVVRVYVRNVTTGAQQTAFAKTYPKSGGFNLVGDINASVCSAFSAPDGGFYIEHPEFGSGGNVSFTAFQTRSGKQMGLGPAAGTNTGPAVLLLTPADTMLMNVQDDITVSVNNGAFSRVELPGTTPAALASAINAVAGLNAAVEGANVKVTTTAVGAAANVKVRYRRTRANIITATGKTLDNGTLETRVYVYTLVNKEAGLDTESAPSPASLSVDVFADQTVTVGGFATVPSGYAATHRRIYRSVMGTYLFVKEVTVGTASTPDSALADDLGEELPSLDWAMPPPELSGLVNLPNGMMAGFVGRDIYFCEPYRPYAWPEKYIQTVDFPVVGLGALDTTLVVLTRGTPYFMQGAHPDSIVIVKTDIEQACVSKRSIVSIAGGVVYASPDGLVSVSPGRSKVISEDLMTREQWQALFAPSSIHAYEHDLKYHAFYNTGSAQGGFILDFASGSLTLHDRWMACGFADLRTDTLYLASGATLRKWAGGAPLTYTWRGKRNTLPYISGFSCAQVEAEAYPVTLQVYADQALIHTQTVTSRNPFRLPPIAARDWEVSINTNAEVYNVVVAQSPEELARV